MECIRRVIRRGVVLWQIDKWSYTEWNRSEVKCLGVNIPKQNTEETLSENFSLKKWWPFSLNKLNVSFHGIEGKQCVEFILLEPSCPLKPTATLTNKNDVKLNWNRILKFGQNGRCFCLCHLWFGHHDSVFISSPV